MPSQSFQQPLTVTILIGLIDQALKTLFDESAPVRINLRAKGLKAQSQGVFDNSFEPLGEGYPLRGSVKDAGADQVPEEMQEATLFQESTDLVIGSKEVADQYPLEELPQDRFEDRGGSGGGDQIIGDLAPLTGKAPKPVSFP